jgi:hypothetical protein
MGLLIAMLGLVILVVIPFWKICERIGWPPYWSLLMLLPALNLGFLYYIAFSDWPAQLNTRRAG